MHLIAGERSLPPAGGHLPLVAVLAWSQRAGLRTDEILPWLTGLSEDQLGRALAYLEAVTNGGAAGRSAAFLHMYLAGQMPADELPALARLRVELRDATSLSEASRACADRTRLAETLHALIFAPPAGEPVTAPAIETTFAFLKGAFLFLESWSALLAADANLPLLLDAVARHGSIDGYYARHPRPRRAIERLIECGFDADHLVFGRGDILELGVSPLASPDAWRQRVIDAARRVIGGRNGGGLGELLAQPSRKIFHRIRKPYEELRRSGARESGTAVLELLREPLVEADGRLLRKGLHVERARVSSVLQEIEYLQAAAGRRSSGGAPERLRASRCSKRVPELMFDNLRFACCLFKPAGLFHGEITRLLLDPLTPMIEVWSDPYPEFLGLVTLYPGRNAGGEPVILLDTFDYDDRLLDFRGYNRTLRFVLDAAVLDAQLAGASKLIVFAAPYGKPVGFANLVRHEIRRHASMRYHPSYFFESADPADGALEDLRAGRHHYTVALGYDRPMRGLIDYGFNHVGAGRVAKWLEGGRGVVEIDVPAYLNERGNPAPAPTLRRVPAPVDAAVHRRPAHHDDEIARREARVLIEAAALAGVPLTLSVTRDPTPETIAQIVRLDAAAFPEALRYNVHIYGERCSRPGASVIMARVDGELVGFALYYPSITGPHDLYLDVLAIVAPFQRRGCGRALLDAVLGLGTVGGYRRLIVLKVHSEHRLHAFYAAAGFRHFGTLPDGDAYEAELGLRGSWAGVRLDRVVRGARESLQKTLAEPVVLRHLEASDALIGTMVSLEQAFRPALRYDDTAFRARLARWDAIALEVRDGARPIAFTVISSDPAVPRHAMYFDSLCIDEAYQNRRIGRVLHRGCSESSMVAGYTAAVFHCEARSASGVDLVALYQSLGAEIAATTSDRFTLVMPLRIAEASPPLRVEST